jgi:hypothetical protein
MKLNTLILASIVATTFAVVGCNKQSTTTTTTAASSAPAANVDTAKLQAAFESAEPAAKTAVDTAVTAIKNADYSGAVTQLQALSGKFTLTDEQQTAVKDTIAAVQKVIADMAGKATGAANNAAADATKAAGDAAGALPK